MRKKLIDLRLETIRVVEEFNLNDISSNKMLLVNPSINLPLDFTHKFSCFFLTICSYTPKPHHPPIFFNQFSFALPIISPQDRKLISPTPSSLSLGIFQLFWTPFLIYVSNGQHQCLTSPLHQHNKLHTPVMHIMYVRVDFMTNYFMHSPIILII